MDTSQQSGRRMNHAGSKQRYGVVQDIPQQSFQSNSSDPRDMMRQKLYQAMKKKAMEKVAQDSSNDSSRHNYYGQNQGMQGGGYLETSQNSSGVFEAYHKKGQKPQQKKMPSVYYKRNEDQGFNPPPGVNDISGISSVQHNQSSTSFLGEIRALDDDQKTPKSKPPLPKRPSKPPRPHTENNRRVEQKGSSNRKSPYKKHMDPQDEVGEESDDDEFQIIDKEKRKGQKNAKQGGHNRYNSSGGHREGSGAIAIGAPMSGGVAMSEKRPGAVNLQRTKGASVKRIAEMKRKQFKMDRLNLNGSCQDNTSQGGSMNRSIASFRSGQSSGSRRASPRDAGAAAQKAFNLKYKVRGGKKVKPQLIKTQSQIKQEAFKRSKTQSFIGADSGLTTKQKAEKAMAEEALKEKKEKELEKKIMQERFKTNKTQEKKESPKGGFSKFFSNLFSCGVNDDKDEAKDKGGGGCWTGKPGKDLNEKENQYEIQQTQSLAGSELLDAMESRRRKKKKIHQESDSSDSDEKSRSSSSSSDGFKKKPNKKLMKQKQQMKQKKKIRSSSSSSENDDARRRKMYKKHGLSSKNQQKKVESSSSSEDSESDEDLKQDLDKFKFLKHDMQKKQQSFVKQEKMTSQVMLDFDLDDTNLSSIQTPNKNSQGGQGQDSTNFKTSSMVSTGEKLKKKVTIVVGSSQDGSSSDSSSD